MLDLRELVCEAEREDVLEALEDEVVDLEEAVFRTAGRM